MGFQFLKIFVKTEINKKIVGRVERIISIFSILFFLIFNKELVSKYVDKIVAQNKKG